MVQTFLTPIYNLLGQIKESSRIMGLFTLCPSIPDGVMNESRLLAITIEAILLEDTYLPTSFPIDK